MATFNIGKTLDRIKTNDHALLKCSNFSSMYWIGWSIVIVIQNISNIVPNSQLRDNEAVQFPFEKYKRTKNFIQQNFCYSRIQSMCIFGPIENCEIEYQINSFVTISQNFPFTMQIHVNHLLKKKMAWISKFSWKLKLFSRMQTEIGGRKERIFLCGMVIMCKFVYRFVGVIFDLFAA